MKEIEFFEIDGVRIGNAQNIEAQTGVTVLLFDNGAAVGIDISGGGPASRETPLASPLTANNPLNALVFSGGSAYGLAASDGVMRYLEERDIGYPTGFAKVPLVCQSCIYDLNLGSSSIRPDASMGYAACQNAELPHRSTLELCGTIGAGTGASVGKLCGPNRASKTGIGIYAASIGELKMAAVVVLNAMGDVFNPKNGKKIAGLLTESGDGFADSKELLYQLFAPTDLFTGNTPLSNSNTTIGAIITNGKFSTAELNKIASMTRCAYARCINPVGTMADGDSIYALSVGTVAADINMAGTFAADVMEQAIQRAALS